MTNKELDIEACKTFVCPNFNEMEINCKKLGLDDETIKICKEIGIEYLRKTYHTPKYASINSVIPAFIYIGSNLYYEDGIRCIPGAGRNRRRKIGRRELGALYGVTGITVSKWIGDIISILDIQRKE